MKTTLNPFENAKRTAQGTGGGVSPAVIEKMQAEISVLGSQNKTQAQDITDIKGSLNSINDKLAVTNVSSGFYFDTTVVTGSIQASRYGNIITVYAVYTPKATISDSNPFLFSQTYDVSSDMLGFGTGGTYYVGAVTHKIDVRPKGSRTANNTYYLCFSFITTTA